MSVWSLTKKGFDKKEAAEDGNRFLCANGYMGLRGVCEESTSALFPAITLSGVYDKYQSFWREPVNAPNCLYALVTFNEQKMALEEKGPAAHQVQIDYRYGLFHRETDFGSVVIKSERFVSMADCHLLMDQIQLTFASDGEAVIETGISTDLWDINGPHLFDFTHEEGEVLLTRAVTGEKKIIVTAAQCAAADHKCEEVYAQNANGVFRILRRNVKKGETLTVSLFAAVYTSLETSDPCEKAKAICLKAKKAGYLQALKAHRDAWEEIHRRSEAVLSGNAEAEQAMHASQYFLNSIAPRHANNMSIPARGLSGQTYKGAIFWDSEMFFFPMFVYTQPEIAESLLRYRIETLPGALKKAAEYGYRGAFYAWESQEGGEEGCTNFNVVDVFTHRPVRTYFRDKQIHITADIAYALRRHYEITGSRALLEEGGARVMLECARFCISRASVHADHDSIDYADVIGPDEYHERVTNNAFTNQMNLYCMESALQLKEVFADRAEWFAGLLQKMDYAKDWALLRELCARVRRPNKKNGVIEQFDGYFALEDCSLATVRGRLCDPREYWGGDHGVAGATQIIKQADVIALMALFPDQFTDEEVAANFDYYEPRTEHGSSLSACMYALAACRIGRLDQAWALFMRTARIDITGGGKQWAGEIYIGGTHPASNGGAWMIAALGFAGLHIKDGKPELNPHLPKQLKKLSFPITLNGKTLHVTVTHEGGHIE